MKTLLVFVTSLAIVHLSSAQIFPFSNLRAFFDPKSKQPRDADQTSGAGSANVSRPHRQAEHDPLPPLQDFTSPDIYTINKDFGSYQPYTPSTKYTPGVSYTPVESYVTATEASRTTTRRRNSSRYRARPQHQEADVIKSPEEDIRVNSVFITPRPSTAADHLSGDQPNQYSTKRTRTKQVIIQDYHPVGPLEVEPEEDVNPEFSENHSVRQSFAQSPEDADEDVLPLADSEQTSSSDDRGLVDYLVPPQLPSVYEKTRKRSKLRNQGGPIVPKQKPPTRASSLKKNGRYRVKKHRGEVPSAGAPLADRTTAAKRHVGRRRPSYRREPTRTPAKKIPVRHPDLQKQASEMDEQITAETGFSEAGAHPRSPHVGERVEFQMHGQKGPHSYKFGYDTGKGHNRQFRFEEKDNHGRVKGHYGYYDKDGKLQLVNYAADPHHGFTADTV